MKFKPCIECGVSQTEKEQVFLTDDGYCSVCNHKFRDRERPKSIFQFTTIKEGNYDHLTHLGTKRTKDYDKKQELYNKAKSGGIIAAGVEYQEYKKKKQGNLKEYLK